MTRRIYVAMWLVVTLAASAAPAYAAEAVGVNPPGWVGGLLALLSLALPVALAVILRRKGSL